MKHLGHLEITIMTFIKGIIAYTCPTQVKMHINRYAKYPVHILYNESILPFRRSFGSLFKDEIRAALGCAPAISTRPKHFHSSLSTNSTPRMCGNRGLGAGSCTPGSVNGGGTTLTTATASPGTYRHNNGAGVSLVGNRGTSSNTTNKNYAGGSSRNGLVYFGNCNSIIFKIFTS